jgi:23S rRNA (adenine1618-N6)-methyltransferase
MVCEGGEVSFVSRILTESLVLRERVQWYTSMVGKLSSLDTIVTQLREKGIDNYAVTEFVQGRKTRRWAVGWSFASMRPSQPVSRGMKPMAWKNILPHISEVNIRTMSLEGGMDSFALRIEEVVGSLDLISWNWEQGKLQGKLQGIGRSSGNVWSRAWRRKKLKAKSEGILHETLTSVTAQSASDPFGFRIAVHLGQAEVKISVHWLEGHDPACFESFCGFLAGRLESS